MRCGKTARLTDSTYWDLAPHGQASTASSYLAGNENGAKDLEDDVYATLDQAVRMQTVSDVPVGLFLSGGIDSSSLAGILSRAGIRLNTFSISFSRGGIQRSRIFPRRSPGFCHGTSGDHGVAGRRAGCHSVRAQGHGSAHDRWSQYISHRPADSGRRDQSGAFGSGRG